ncbi:zinc-ribbon domain containing protein [Dehalococcoidia bacterium]|nr:zinc-ribbon domain containing protein [Dehalococcoidia bacterium]
MVFQDRDLTCVECSQTFVFSADDQQYHQDKGYTNEPKRCPSCRQSRRTSRGYDGGGGGGFGGGMRREMHSVTCAECGKDAEVPFLPRGDRPVYCDDCFRQRRDRQPDRGSFRY